MTLNVKVCKKLKDFSKILEDFLQNQDKSHQNIVYLDVQKGQSTLQSQIAAKPLEASGVAASFLYGNGIYINWYALIKIRKDKLPVPVRGKWDALIGHFGCLSFLVSIIPSNIYYISIHESWGKGRGANT